MYELLCGAYLALVIDRHPEHNDTLDDATLRNLSAVAAAIQDDRRFGFIINGAVGNGKTTTLRALREALRWLRSGYQSDMPTLNILDSRSINTMDNDVRSKIMNVQLLAIDDVGKEGAEVMKYGNNLQPIAEILEYRYERQLFTAMTSNLPAADIAEKYGPRVYDRMVEMMKIVTFANPSFRK